MTDLKTPWLFMCSQLFLRSERTQPADWGSLFDELIARYQEPHRVYHGVNHLEECFTTLARLPEEHWPKDREALTLALFAHDAVYVLMNDRNEVESAGYADALAFLLSGDPEMTSLVWQAVMDTRHQGSALTHTGAVLCDIDLAHFAEPWESFLAKRALVEREYEPLAKKANMSAPAFANARAGALRPFLDRPSIYQTPWFRDRFERQAQANLERHIRELTVDR
jgi:predicted metal-dependent HD superfamily phosphohydrolase